MERTMKSRAKKQRQQTGRDRWTLTSQGIAATDLDDLGDLDDWDDDFDHPSGLPPFALAMARADLNEACARAAWGSRPASASAPSRSPDTVPRPAPPPSSPSIERSAPHTALPIERDTPPATVWEALRRLLACNKQELAARLGVSRHTLQRWERDELTETGAARVAALMQETLTAAGAGWTVAPPSRLPALKRGHRPAKSPG